MFKVFLIIYNVTFTPGAMTLSTADGFASREQPNWKVCIQRRDRFNREKSIDGKLRVAVCRKYVKDNH